MDSKKVEQENNCYEMLLANYFALSKQAKKKSA
jgi:hypothetical protein